MSYVTYVFQSYFGYSKAKAEKLMMDVHLKGRAAVANGDREGMERHVAGLQGLGLGGRRLSGPSRPSRASACGRRCSRTTEVTRGFRRVRGEVRARLGDDERRVLHDVFTEVYDLLEDRARSEPAEADPLAALVGIGTAVRP